MALPNQTIRTEEYVAEHGVPTTRRRLTYDDLLVHLRHYSPGMRKGMSLASIVSAAGYSANILIEPRCFAGSAGALGRSSRVNCTKLRKFTWCSGKINCR